MLKLSSTITWIFIAIVVVQLGCLFRLQSPSNLPEPDVHLPNLSASKIFIESPANTNVGGKVPAAGTLRELVTAPDGVIRGNPTDNPVCRHALLNAHGYETDVLVKKLHNKFRGKKRQQLKPNLPPSFWSREALAAVQAPIGRHDLVLHGTSIQSNWDIKDNETQMNFTRIASINIVKCGTSTVQEMLNKQKHPQFDRSFFINDGNQPCDHMVLSADCAFSFVRDPLHRLISAYFTINLMMKREDAFQSVKQKWIFWKVSSEPERFRTFIHEMMGRTNEFMALQPLQHIVTMSGAMSSWLGTDIPFIGRVEQFSDHWQLLLKTDHCRDLAELRDTPLSHAMSMKYTMENMGDWSTSLGIEKFDPKKDSKFSLPQYMEISRDQQLFNDIVEHYWQDYICFGYGTNYPELGLKYTGRFVKPY